MHQLFHPILPLSKCISYKGPKEQLGPCHSLEGLGDPGHITGISGHGSHLHSEGLNKMAPQSLGL